MGLFYGTILDCSECDAEKRYPHEADRDNVLRTAQLQGWTVTKNSGGLWYRCRECSRIAAEKTGTTS